MLSSPRRWLAASVAALAFAGTATIAVADQAKAKQLYEDGEKAYNLGQFDKAIQLFTNAYEEWPEAAFLFNIAQAYRQAGDCKQALFFYKRFLSLKENDTKKPIKPEVKKDVEGRIAELEDCVKRDIANKPPDSLDSGAGGSGSTSGSGGTTVTGGGSGSGGTTTGDGDGDGSSAGSGAGSGSATRVAGGGDGTDTGEGEGEGSDTGVVAGTQTEMPKLLSVHAQVGVGTLGGIGGAGLDTPPQLAIALTGGYPLAVGDKLELDLGAAVTFTPVPWASGSASGTGAWTTLMANVGADYTVAPKISVRADVGAGALLFSGLSMGNPFVADPNAQVTGALTVFGFRVAASAEYAVTKNLVAQVTPIGFLYGAAPAGFKSSITSLTSLEFMAGIGYRM